MDTKSGGISMKNEWSVCIVRDGKFYYVKMHNSDITVIYNDEVVYEDDLHTESYRLPEDTKQMLARTVIDVYEQKCEADSGMQSLMEQERFKGWNIMN